MAGPSSDSTALDRYLNELRALPQLEAEEEKRLAGLAATGDREARDRLMKAHLRFVVSEARRYRHHGLPLEDLIEEGNLGLLAAVERYDPTRGCRFLTYAVWWIRHAILKALHDKARLIRLPAHQLVELSAMERARERFRKEHGRNPNHRELAGLVGSTPQRVEQLASLTEDVVSLDAPLGDGDGATERGEVVADATALRGDEEVLRRLLDQELHAALAQLSPREADILVQHFGLDGCKRRSLDEIGVALHLARERVRQIESHALRKLRRSAQAGRLQDWVGEGPE